MVFFTDCTHLYQLRRYLKKAIELNERQSPGWVAFDDTDHAVEWCENQLIELETEAGYLQQKVDISSQYLCSGMSDAELRRLEETGVKRTFAAGECIVRMGAPADCMYFILSGEVEVVIDTDTKNRLRLTTMGAGTVFGEVALINNKNRTADVLATTETQCLQVCFGALDDGIRTKMLINMAGHFATKIEHDTELIRHLS
jgi:glutaminase